MAALAMLPLLSRWPFPQSMSGPAPAPGPPSSGSTGAPAASTVASTRAVSSGAVSPAAPGGSATRPAASVRAASADAAPSASSSGSAVRGATLRAAAAPPLPSGAPSSTPTAPPKVSSLAIACSNEEVATLVHRLAAWAARYDEALRTAYADRGCAKADVLCLNRTGEADADEVPKKLQGNQSFAIEIILPVVDRGKVAVSTSGGKSRIAAGPFEDAPATAGSAASDPHAAVSCELTPAQRDDLKSAANPIDRLTLRPGLELLGIPQGSSDDGYWMNATNANIFADWSAWLAARGDRVPSFTAVEAKIEVPFGEPSLEIDFSRAEAGIASASVEQHYSIWVDDGQYHVELSLLVPFVFRGRRVGTLTSTPTGTELQVGLNEDWHVNGAVMLDFFPLGRQKGQASSFQHCRYSSCVENWLGFQFGTGLSSLFQEWYFGLLFEPVSGLALGAGGTFLKGDFLGPGLAQGMLLPAASDFNVKSDYMLRPYFGVAITTDIFQTLDRSSVFAHIW